MPKTVLLVEDNKRLNDINRRALKMTGYTVLVASTIAQARAQVTSAAENLDVILLDIALPDGNGVDFCGEIREQTTAYILFLTSVQAHEVVVRSLNTGGDDYITKPYKLEEMLARVNAAMRRRTSSFQGSQVITLGDLSLNPVGAQALLREGDLGLTPKEFFVLYALAQNEGKAVEACALYETVWKQPMQGNDHALKNVIYRLRKKLKAEQGSLRITTSRSTGYSLSFSELPKSLPVEKRHMPTHRGYR